MHFVGDGIPIYKISIGREKIMENKSLKAVIFDLDGVLVFTDKFHYQAWKAIADELGIYFDEKINNRLRGVSRMDSLEIILENDNGRTFSDEEKEALAAKKNELYRKQLQTMSYKDVSDETRKVLKKLRERGYAIALGSSSKNARFILENVELLDAFDQISDGNNITKSKPDPEVFLKASALLGIRPEECLVVEDAEAGVLAGMLGGMKTAAIGEAVSCGKADFTLGTLTDLLKILV